MKYDFYVFNNYVTENCNFLFNKLGGLPRTVIEIGVFTGFFTFNMLETIAPQIPGYKHIAIDPFETSPDLKDDVIANAYKTFLKNMDVCDYRSNLEFKRQYSYEIH